MSIDLTNRLGELGGCNKDGRPVDIVRLREGEAGLFGYGSLLLQSSMEQTLGRPYAGTRYACELRGWRRCWNLLYPNNNQFYFVKAAGERCYPANIVYLNIYRVDTSVNGVIYIISEAELAGFDRREWPYDRVNIAGDLIDCEVRGGPVWAYAAKREHVLAAPLPAEQTAIRASYIRIVEGGLEELGPAFRQRYVSSTDAPSPSMIVEDHRD